MMGILVTGNLAGTAAAQGKEPEPKRKEPQATLKQLKDKANQALDELDRGIHNAIGPAKKGANDALQAIDDAVHGRKK